MTKYDSAPDEQITAEAWAQEAARCHLLQKQDAELARYRLRIADEHFTYTETKEDVEGIGMCYIHRLVSKKDASAPIVSSTNLLTAVNMALYQIGFFKRDLFIPKEDN